MQLVEVRLASAHASARSQRRHSVVPLVQLTPAARLGDHDKQVSWLAALSLRITFPDSLSSGL